MSRVIKSRVFHQLNQKLHIADVIQEVIVEYRILFFKFTRTYRKVHGTVFVYSDGKYEEVSSFTYSRIKKHFKF